MNSEKWEVILSFIINLAIVPFLLSTSLRKLVYMRSLVRSFAKPAGLFAVLIWLAISVVCDIGTHWLLGRNPLFSLPTSAASALLSPTPSCKCLSCIELCSRSSSLLAHIYVHGFRNYQLAPASQILSTTHSSFLSYRRVYTAAFSAPSLDAPNWMHHFPPKLFDYLDFTANQWWDQYN